MTQNSEMTTLQKVAAGVSGLIIAAAVGYWIVQIASVVEFLEMAYG